MRRRHCDRWRNASGFSHAGVTRRGIIGERDVDASYPPAFDASGGRGTVGSCGSAGSAGNAGNADSADSAASALSAASANIGAAAYDATCSSASAAHDSAVCCGTCNNSVVGARFSNVTDVRRSTAVDADDERDAHATTLNQSVPQCRSGTTRAPSRPRAGVGSGGVPSPETG